MIIFLFADDPELDAQVPAEVSPGEGQRHLEAALLHVPDLRVQGDRVHRGHGVPERKGKPKTVTPSVSRFC